MTEPLSFYLRGRVVKSATKDGQFRLMPDLRLGTVIIVDLYTRHRLSGHDIVGDFIQCMETGGWVPTECLELLP